MCAYNYCERTLSCHLICKRYKMIILKNVTKVYGKGNEAVTALKNVNLVIEDGKFTAVVGKSGSGKTTLMNILGALDLPTSGEVTVNGESLTKKSPKELALYRNKFTGFVFQSFYLEPSFTVLENVAMPLTIAGAAKAEREKKALSLLEKLDIKGKAYKKASELSGGQKQRVCIARALINGPKLVLADEPTGNLDSLNGREVIALLRQIADEGRSVVLVTHNTEDAKNADEIVTITDGIVTSDCMEKHGDLFL